MKTAERNFPHQTFILTRCCRFSALIFYRLPSFLSSLRLYSFFPARVYECVTPGSRYMCVRACVCDVDTYSPTKPFLKVNVPGPGYMLEARQPENCSPLPSNLLLVSFSPSFSSTRAHTRCALYSPECIPRCEQAPEHVCSLFRDTPPFNQTSYHTHSRAGAHTHTRGRRTCGGCRAHPGHDERVSKAIKIVERCPRC